MNENIAKFLVLNGFKKIDDTTYQNNRCTITTHDYGFRISKGNSFMETSDTDNIYCLIGVLTYTGCMDKNYKQTSVA